MSDAIPKNDPYLGTGRGYQLDGAPRWVPFNLNVTGDLKSPASSYNISFSADIESLLEDGCLFMALADDLLVYGEEYLSGIIQANGASGETGVDGSPSYTLADLEGPDALLSMYNWGDGDFDRLESIFANISNSLTLLIRTQGSPKYSTPAQGEVYHFATCLQLQWPWILFPGILAVLTTIFFFLVAESAANRNTPVWKLSPLAWLLAVRGGQEVETQNSLCGTVTVVKMEEEAKKVRVHLFNRPTPHIGMFNGRA